MSTNWHTPLAAPIANLVSSLNTVLAQLDQGIGGPNGPNGRLTLSATDPVTTGDIVAATTLYYLPYNGQVVWLYDSSDARWYPRILPTAGASLAVPNAVGTNYDVFAYWDNSTSAIRLEALAWTDTTTRATALTKQDGLWVKNGDATRLYVGSIKTRSAGQTDDSKTHRLVANAYNREPRMILRQFTGDHTLTSTSFRAWGGTASAVLVDILCILSDVRVYLEQTCYARDHYVIFGIGLNSETANSAVITPLNRSSTSSPSPIASVQTIYDGYPGVGFHQFVPLEACSGTGTATVVGAAGDVQMGVTGVIWA